MVALFLDDNKTNHDGDGHRRTGNFLPGGGRGGKPFAQKILAICPNFYETVEKKQRPYDAIM